MCKVTNNGGLRKGKLQNIKDLQKPIIKEELLIILQKLGKWFSNIREPFDEAAVEYNMA